MRGLDAKWLLGVGSVAQRLDQTGLSFAVSPQNTLILAVGGEPLSLNVVAPAAFAGASVFAPSDLTSGPVDIVAPAILGAPVAGQTVTTRPAIWAHGGTPTGPDVTRQWYRDGASIPGATQSNYTPQAGDVGLALTVVESASDDAGARSVESAPVVVSA